MNIKKVLMYAGIGILAWFTILFVGAFTIGFIQGVIETL